MHRFGVASTVMAGSLSDWSYDKVLHVLKMSTKFYDDWTNWERVMANFLLSPINGDMAIYNRIVNLSPERLYTKFGIDIVLKSKK